MSTKPLYVQLKTVQSFFKELTFEFQKAHWLVRGSDFSNLHSFFQECYEWSLEQEDQFAEALLMRNEIPVIKYDEISRRSDLVKTETKDFDPTILIDNLEKLSEHLTKLNDLADDEDDLMVEDFALQALIKTSKIKWQIKTHYNL